MKQQEPPTTIHSWLALVIYLVVMLGAFVWATFKPTAPFSDFAWPITAGVGAYFGKRLYQRKFSPYGGGFAGETDANGPYGGYNPGSTFSEGDEP
jgi:hypothetical protein